MASVTESDFFMAVSNLLHEKYKHMVQRTDSDQIFSFFSVHENCNLLKKLFRTEDIENIVECLNDEFEEYTMSRMKWASKPKIGSSRVTPNFPFSVVFVYSKDYFSNSESRYCLKTLS